MSIKHLVRLLPLIPLILLFLIPNLSSAATESVRVIRQDCTGYTNCYTSLSAWEAGEQRDLTATDEVAVARIEGTWTNPDTAAVMIDGWTTDATRYIKIYTTAEARHSGVWSDTKYRLEVSNNYRPIFSYANHIRIDGLQIGNNTPTNYGVGMLFRPNGGSSNTDIQISNNIIRSTVSPTYNVTGIDLAYGALYKVWNNIIYDFSNSSARGIFIWNNAANGLSTTYLHNNTIYNSYTGITAGNGTTIAKNNIIQGATYGYSGTFHSSSDYNITNTASGAPGANSKNSATVSFADSANKNFHLASSDTAALNSGTDLSSDPDLAFTADIDGETRSGTWDIGADEYAGSSQGGGTPPPPSDTTAPTRSGGAPSGALAAGTTQTTISLITNENATCKYGTVANTAYASMANTLTTTGGTTHSVSITGLQNGQSYTYYIRCQDSAGNMNTDDFTTSFAVDIPVAPVQTQTTQTQTQTSGSETFYYVSPTGTALWLNCAGSTPLSGTAACSWQTAMANARAGDTVYFRGGTYEPGAGDPDAPKIYPANDGTAQASITFQAYPGETATIHEASWNATAPANNTKPALGCYRNSYIVWDGFTFVRNLDNGYQASSIVKFESSDHCILRNSELIGRPHIDQYNGALISIVQSSYIYIYNNKLHGMSRDPNAIITTVNTTAIWSFNYDHIYIYNNDFYDNYGNINTKVGTSNLYIYNNHIWNCGYSATRATPQNDGVTDISIYNNVIRNCPTALDSPDPGPGLNYGIKFYNNTIYNSGIGTLAGIGSMSYQKHRNTEIFNNIISNQGSNSLWGRYFNTLDSGAGFPTYMNYNDYHGTGRWNMNYTTDYSTLTAWQTALGVDSNSITSNPLFVNPGGTTPEDYKLQGDSPARIGRGGSYAAVMGAYITGNEIIGYVAPNTQGGQATDTTAPSIPANLSATAISTSQINLSWSASTDNTAVTGYRIYRNGTQLTTTTGTTYSNTSLTPSTLYTYTVLAYDGAGNTSSQSTSASATTQAVVIADTTAPTLGTISSSVTTTGATITWTTNEAGTSRVEYGLTTSYGNTTPLTTTPTTSHSHSLSVLSSNTTYHYRVTTTDSSGNSAVSQDRTFTTSAVTDTTAPSSITNLTTSSIGQTSLTLSWTVPTDTSGIASYDIRYATTPITDTTFSSATQLANVPLPTTSGTTQTQYISVGLTPNTTYSFAIKSTDALGNVSLISNIATGTTLSAPTTTSTTPSTQTGTISVPTSSGGGGGGGGSFTIYQLSDVTPPKNPADVRIQPTNTQAVISWANPTDPDFVRVKIVRKTGSAVSSHTDGTVVYDGTGTTFTDTNLTNNQTYYYGIYAYDKVPNYTQTLGLSVTPQANLTQTNIAYTTIEAGCTETTTYSTITGNPCTKVPTAFRPFYTFSNDRAITYGMKDSTDVRELQKILQFEGLLSLSATADGAFGPGTKTAIIAFQKKYALSPAAGNVGPLTKTKLNALYGSTTSSATFYRNLTLGSKGDDVKKLQQLLNTDIATRIASTGAGSPGNETTTFGPATKAAVIKYQKKYNIAPASGYVGPKTRGMLEGR